MKKITTVEELMTEIEKGTYRAYGLRRASERDMEVINSGEIDLPCSKDWFNRDETGASFEELPELSGTCAIGVDSFFDSENTIEKKYDQVVKTYGPTGNPIILIGGETSEYGDDAGELIIGYEGGYGAEAIAIVEL